MLSTIIKIPLVDVGMRSTQTIIKIQYRQIREKQEQQTREGKDHGHAVTNQICF